MDGIGFAEGVVTGIIGIFSFVIFLYLAGEVLPHKYRVWKAKRDEGRRINALRHACKRARAFIGNTDRESEVGKRILEEIRKALGE